MFTIGEAIKAKAQEYIDLYDRLRVDEQFRNQAAGLAQFDLRQAIYIDTEALALVNGHIDRQEQTDAARELFQ